MLKGIPRRGRWCRRPLTQERGRGLDGLDDWRRLELVEKDEGRLVFLVTVYYLGIGNVNQTDLNMDGGFESLSDS